MAEVEKFKKTFEKLHASPDVLTEVMNMAANEKIVPIRKRKYMNKIAAAIAAVVLAVGSGSVAYAMDPILLIIKILKEKMFIGVAAALHFMKMEQRDR